MARKYTWQEISFVEGLSGSVPDKEIAKRFAARFGREPTACAIGMLRYKYLMAIRPAPYSDAEIAFVRRLSGRVPNREIAERFAARFGREPTAMSIRGLRRNQLMPTLRKHHVYTDAEIAFVRMLSGRKPNREIAALFNRRFHADVSPTAISVLRYRHDMPLTIMRHTPGQRRFVFDRIGHMGPEELHDLFVSKFGRVTYGAFKTFMWDVMREGRQA